MRIVVVSAGTSGEIRPFAIIARALRVRGHDVVEDVKPLEIRAGETAQEAMNRTVLGIAPGRFARLAELCRGAQLLIAGTHPIPALVARSCGVPLLCVVLEPASLAHADYRPMGSPPPRGRLRVLASSAHFSVPDLTFYEDLRVTGFIFEEAANEPPLSVDLDAWIAAGSKPIVLSLGSRPAVDAEAVATIACESAALAGRRLIIQPGGSIIHERAIAGADAVLAGFEPHARLFPRAVAIIHDGSIGTTAEALRCGRPMLVLPQRLPQFFNARALRRLGVGAAMRRDGLEARSLARILERRVLSEEPCVQSASIARKLATDNGLAAVCALAERSSAG